ncbi:hypothetical protein METY_3384 [Methylopila sp. Yamaguchi]|nr:hypothetical protein METY_3384 [Methylopila sp. Yamaguchi]
MTNEMANGATYLFWAAGIFLIGVALAFGALSRARRSKARNSGSVTRRLYEAESRDPLNR